jgi:hypothetical protein
MGLGTRRVFRSSPASSPPPLPRRSCRPNSPPSRLICPATSPAFGCCCPKAPSSVRRGRRSVPWWWPTCGRWKAGCRITSRWRGAAWPAWGWDADGVKGTAARMEQLSVHARLVQLYVPSLVGVGEVPPPPGVKGFGGAGRGSRSSSEDVRAPVWLGKGYPLRQAGDPGARSGAGGGWQAGILAGAFAPCWARGGAVGVGGT